MKKSRAEVLILVVVAVVLGFFTLAMYRPDSPPLEDISLSGAQQVINDGRAEKVLRDGDRVYVFMANGKVKRTLLEREISLADQGIDATKTRVENGSYASGGSKVLSVIYALIPVVVIAAPLILGVYVAFRVLKHEKKHRH